MKACWFDAALPPPQPDIYLVRVPHITAGEAYALWDGERWLCWSTTPELAEIVRIIGPEDGYDWRPVDWLKIV